MGSIPAPGKSHMPHGNWIQASQVLSQRSRAPELQLLKPERLEPVLHNKSSHHSKKPEPRKEEEPALAASRESLSAAAKTHGHK